MNNKIVSTKTTNAVFLAIVLFTGTFAAISPSFNIGEAQAAPYYGMDSSYNDRKSYGMDDSYEYSDYRDDRKKYDSYEPTDYRDNKDRKSYGSDSYKSQYQPSYKPDYKAKYPSDNNYKSKDTKSVSINKLKCINNNLNINGNNAGNVSIGNKGSTGGYLGASSSDGSGGYGGEGYSKQGKGFDCIINNNNNNINVVGGGNVTDGNGNVTDACEECFLDNLSPEQEIALAEELAVNFTQFGTIKGLCEHLADETISPISKADTLNFILLRIGVPMDTRDDIRDCLIELGFDIFRS